MRVISLPNNFVLKVIFPENLVEHDLDVVAGVPVAVVVKASGLLEHAGQFDASRVHVADVGLSGGVTVIEGPLLLVLAPEGLVIAIAVERGIDVDQVHAGGREFFQLIQIPALVGDSLFVKSATTISFAAHGLPSFP